MDGLIAEIQRFIDKEYVLDFKIPTKTEMNKLRTINRERSASDTRKIEEAQKGVRTLLDLVAKGELDASQIPEFGSLIQEIKKPLCEVLLDLILTRRTQVTCIQLHMFICNMLTAELVLKDQSALTHLSSLFLKIFILIVALQYLMI